MFDFDSAKIVLFAAVALLFVGPRELPGVLRVVGRVVAQIRRVRDDLRKAAEGLMADASLDREAAMIDESARLAVARNPATAMRGGHTGAAVIETTAMAYSSPEMLAYLAPPPETTARRESSEDVR